MRLGENEKTLLNFLLAHKQSSTVHEASSALGASADAIRAAAESLSHMGLITKENRTATQISYTPEGKTLSGGGLYEVRLLRLLKTGSKQISSLEPDLKRFAIPAAKKRGWIIISGPQISLSPAGAAALEKKDYITLPSNPSELLGAPAQVLSELEHRGIILLSVRVEDTCLTLTSEGAKHAAQCMDSEGEIGALSRSILLSGEWKGKNLAKYDLHAPTAPSFLARRHPISRLRESICTTFSQMGFEEMGGPVCESAFWNFDSLFQPQDHPARDLADTFYLEEKSPLPPSALADKVCLAHKNGWGYDWSRATAEEMVLRTHTTAVSARALYDSKDERRPRKFFSIGKVFRNEATDYKHLAEFYQVEGIIAWEGAAFPHLLGTLKEFYLRIGFGKIRFRPSYFPYTEPSLEVEVFHPQRKEWIELGGAGILRPEVTLPLCNKYPVLAWGLSLERPLMLSSSTPDIRTLYRNDLNWLRDFKIKI